MLDACYVFGKDEESYQTIFLNLSCREWGSRQVSSVCVDALDELLGFRGVSRHDHITEDENEADGAWDEWPELVEYVRGLGGDRLECSSDVQRWSCD